MGTFLIFLNLLYVPNFQAKKISVNVLGIFFYDISRPDLQKKKVKKIPQKNQVDFLILNLGYLPWSQSGNFCDFPKGTLGT